MNVCIYLRKSRKDKIDEPEEETLRRHEVTLLAYAKEHKLNIIEIRKEVRSGESLAKRPQMMLMLSDIEDRKYDAVLVMDIDRLTRGDMLDQGIIISTLKRNNVKIITLERVYNLDDDLDEEMVDFNAFFARKEFKMINKRLSRGRIQSIKEGNYIGGFAPYGYRYDKATKSLVTHEHEANIVKMIYDMYLNKNIGHRQITNFLNNTGILTSKNSKWNENLTKRILSNPIYAGKVSWSKNTDNPLICDGRHKALVSLDDYNKVQQIAKDRYIPKVKDGYELKNPLAQLILCSECNLKMGLRTSKKWRDTLRCKHNCTNICSYVYKIEERLLQITYDYLLNLKNNFNYSSDKNDNSKLIKKNIDALTKEYDKICEQRNKLFDLLEQGIYDNATFLERMNVIKNKSESIQNSIQKLNDELTNIKNDDEHISLPEIAEYIVFIDNYYEKCNAKERNEFLRKIINYAVYSKTKKGLDTFKLQVFFKF